MYPTYTSSSSSSSFSSSPSTARYSSSTATATAGYSDYGIRSSAALQQQQQRQQNNSSLPSVYRNNYNNNVNNTTTSVNNNGISSSNRNNIFVYDFDTQFERTILERVERECEALEKRKERWREWENQLQQWSDPVPDNRNGNNDDVSNHIMTSPSHHNNHKNEELDFESRCKSLCVELGYDASMAEFALSAYKDEEMKVLDLITKMDQLLRFGYREQDVKEALIVSDREINAALDYLAKK